MDKKLLTRIIIAVMVAVVVGVIFIKFRSMHEEESPTQSFVRKRGGACPGETKTYTMNDPYMRGVIEPGQKFKVIMNYYDCNPVKRGDLVFYQMHKSMDPVVKYARAVGGDKFSLSKDDKYKAWNIKVDGEFVRSEVDQIPYFFGGPTAPPLASYERTHKGKVQTGDVIILSSWPPGDIDSGTFGMFSMEDVVGKVEIIDAPKVVQTPSPKVTPKATPTPTPKAPAKPTVKPVTTPTPLKTPAKQ